MPSAVCATTPEDEQIMLEPILGPWFSINWIKSASRWFHYTAISTRRLHLDKTTGKVADRYTRPAQIQTNDPSVRTKQTRIRQQCQQYYYNQPTQM
jgi:hypothetical protein